MTWLINPYRFGVPGTGGPGAPLHRYWEVYLISTTEGSPLVGSIEMAATVGGPNLATTPANGSAFGYWRGVAPAAPGNAFDGSPTTKSQLINNNSPFGVAWRYDFGVSTLIGELAIVACTDANSHLRSPDTFVLRGSDDAITWFTYLLVIRAPFTAPGQRLAWPVGARFPTSGRENARGWCVDYAVNNGRYTTNVSEMRWYSGGVHKSALPSGSPGAGTPLIGTSFADAMDGTTWANSNHEKMCDPSGFSTRWASPYPTNGRIGFVFPTVQDCDRLDLGPEGAATNGMLKTFAIRYTTDFNTWNTVLAPPDQTAWAGGALRSFTW